MKDLVAETEREKMGFVVIGKTRTLIWGKKRAVTRKPLALYDPHSRPALGNYAHSKATSNYDSRDYAAGPLGRFSLIPGWMRPNLDARYCKLICERIEDFKEVFILGGGIWKWSGVNNFLDYVAENHPDLLEKIEYRRYFRLTDFSEAKTKKIFHEMVDDYLEEYSNYST